MPAGTPHGIRPMRLADAASVARLHAARLPESFLGRLGEGFLTALYRAMLADGSFLGLVAEDADGLAGYIAATRDPLHFQGRVYRRDVFTLASRLALRAAAAPGLLLDTARLLVSRPPAEAGEPGAAELLSIAAARPRTGLGGSLVSEACARLGGMGSRFFLVQVGEGIAANHFYRAVGFSPSSRHRLHGADMIVYRRPLGSGHSGGE